MSEKTLRVLIVEDDQAVARAIARVLRGRGHQVVLTHRRADALAAEGPFDCGVFDVDLPDGNGVDIASRLLSARQVRRAVFFSASGDAAVTRRAAKLGKFVHKTEGMIELGRAVGDAVRAKRKVANGDELESSVPPPGKSGPRRKPE